jgi:hypothetical protein
MWNLFNCYLSGRHEFGVWAESGTIFLRCMHCGRRSSGWEVNSGVPASTITHPNSAIIGLTARAQRDNNTERGRSPHF